jgi:N-acetylglucosamine kinase-like BadF-type ATPase
MTSYVLGIDGGGTKTQAVILDDQARVAGIGIGGPANADDIGLENTIANIASAVYAARTQAGLRADISFSAVFLGLAGVVSEQDHAMAHEIAARLRLADNDRVQVDHDCRIALAGGLSGRPGIVLIAGTGAACFGVNAKGEKWLAGAWGHLIADEGSSYWLGLQAIRAAVAAWDGRAGRTLLQEPVRQALGLNDFHEVMHRVYVEGFSRAQIAALAQIVTAAAQAGDRTALGLIREGARRLAESTRAVARRLSMHEIPCDVVLVGGLLGAGEIVMNPVRGAIQHKLPHARCVKPELSPVLGAGVLALAMLGISAHELPYAQNLRASVPGSLTTAV